VHDLEQTSGPTAPRSGRTWHAFSFLGLLTIKLAKLGRGAVRQVQTVFLGEWRLFHSTYCVSNFQTTTESCWEWLFRRDWERDHEKGRSASILTAPWF